MEKLSEAFRVLGDSTRLRIIRLVGEARLNASELVSLVGIAQSSMSHHLAKLKSFELIAEERVGGFIYYALAVTSTDTLWPLVELARKSKDEHGDATRLAELLSQREDAQSLNEKLLEPGQSWRLWAAALASLLPPLEVADFGCGSGALAFELSRWAKRVTAVDSNATILNKARAESKRLNIDNVFFLQADLASLPLSAASHDVVVISQSLHHVTAPHLALLEAARILRPGGKLLILELEPHQETWVRRRLGHQHLGLDSTALVRSLAEAGFVESTIQTPPRENASPFRAFVVSATRRKGVAKSLVVKPRQSATAL